MKMLKKETFKAIKTRTKTIKIKEMKSKTKIKLDHNFINQNPRSVTSSNQKGKRSREQQIQQKKISIKNETFIRSANQS